ncbi:hypothetical protein AcW1_004771 [Taiwanofungus camphoratus]|nr:hypothetical protein AcW2_006224 [Antrodia cinnamomea]KAI0938158.1 hypothetical protein AcV7_003431 [Antrodia cinnamomea]KAI0939908.1 hypothetical protein AcV5_001154 [Antrodia cinnamomea]KAI0960191.1 hypothetical protein AcW1_004771 [Antrodia cinnamomea]
MGCAFWTAAQGLFHPDRARRPPNQVSQEEWILMYGGSTSVAMFVLQLAHVSGYNVVTVASPKNYALCRFLGANVLFEYKDHEVVSKIKGATNNSLHHALGIIYQAQTQTFTIKAFRPGPGKIIVIQPP